MKPGDIVQYVGEPMFPGMTTGQKAQVVELYLEWNKVQVRTFTSDGRESGSGAVPLDLLRVVDCPETRSLAASADEYTRRYMEHIERLQQQTQTAKEEAYATTALACGCPVDHVRDIVTTYLQHYKDPNPY